MKADQLVDQMLYTDYDIETSSVPHADLNAGVLKQANPTGLPVWLILFQTVDLNPA